MRYLVRLGLAALVAAGILTSQASAGAAGAVLVTNANDAGTGSFRAAVALASDSESVGQIVIVGGLDPIVLASPVVYTGAQSLSIVANGAVLDGNGFRAETEGDLSVVGLTVRNAPGEGLEYELSPDASGTRSVSLIGVTLADNDGHGAVVDDQANPEDTSNPGGSDASLQVSVVNSTFEGNGFGALDHDGLRVNEGGAGSLWITIRNSSALANGADGIELDERASGDVVFTVSGTRIAENGSFDVTEEDLDDGMDVDEAGAGSLVGRVSNSSSSDNFEEGFDFNENHLGDLVVELSNVEASRNREEGIDLEEDDDFSDFPDLEWGGDLRVTASGIVASANSGGDGGLKLRERAVGSIHATVRGARTDANDDAGVSVREQEDGGVNLDVERVAAASNGEAGILVREDADGSLDTAIDRSYLDDNGEDGVELDENGAGDLTAAVSRGSASGNGGYGVRADQQTPGSGQLVLLAMSLEGNASGAFSSNVPVVQ